MATALHIRSLTIDGEELAGHVHGGVLVPPHEANWLIHLTTTRSVELTVGREYVLSIATREGTTVDGRAVLRRSDGQSHYFIGGHPPEELLAASA